MKPDFALSLSFEGITLLHRAAGGWRRVGEVSLDTGDLGAELAALRARAAEVSDGPVTTKLILPNDQIRYLTVDTGTFEGDTREEIVRGALASATPYALDDLAFDLCPDGPVTHVAAVARETLAEAEAFAAENDFGPVSFVAIPGDQDFLGEPFFGEASGASALTGGAPVEADGVAVVVTGDIPATAPAPDPEPEPEETPPDTGDEDTPLPAFSSRRERRKQIRQERRAARQTDSDEAEEDTPPPARRLTLHAEADTAAADGVDPVDPIPEPDPAPEPTAETPEPVPAPEMEPETEPEPEPETPPEPSVNVTAPVLDIPDFPDPEDVPEQETAKQSFAGFFSRRKSRARRDPVPPAAPSSAPPPAAESTAVPATPITLPPDQVPQSEAARMTVFGARQPDKVGGKPRHLGLMLTALLLAFLAGVAAWASLFLEDGVSGLFDFGPPETELAAPLDAPAVPRAPTPSVLSTDPALTIPALPPERTNAPATTTSPETPPGLSETDIAVLDALQDTADSAPDTDLPPAAPTAPATAPPASTTDQTAPTDPPEELAALPPLLPSDPDAGFDGQPGGADQALYAATGIWPNAPDPPLEPGMVSLDDLFLAAIDRTDLAHDAVALPAPSELDSDRLVALPALPAAPGTTFALDQSGLVEPSPDGTLNPDGIVIYAGLPPIRPRNIPVRFEREPEIDALRQRLAELRPRARPGDLAERVERSQLGGLTRDELANVRPRLRPASVQDAARETAEPDQPPTAEAVAQSSRPRNRPAGFANRVATVSPPQNSAPEPGSRPAATVSPRIPTSASVARQATLNNAINLRRINLIGVYGSPADRRALVRLPSGRYKKVKVGDSMDGGRVLAIGDSELRYQKGGRNLTLKIPSG